jgi:hypothetical protein
MAEDTAPMDVLCVKLICAKCGHNGAFVSLVPFTELAASRADHEVTKELAKALIRKLRKMEEYDMEQEALGDDVGIEEDPNV